MLAMEGPTPVSALIHAATLVTAGVYLVLRTSPLLEYGPTALVVIAWVGATTAFFAATTGLLMYDMKRVIAYSTCSQLGYMFMAVGMSSYNVALYHLVVHAAMKALLFLAAGAAIHAIADQQDMRRYGGLIGFLPFTYASILVGSLSLMALPALGGFYSKDVILEHAIGAYLVTGQWVYWLGTAGAGLTAYYSFRLINLVFINTPSAPLVSYQGTHDAPFLLAAPMAILAVLSIFIGYVGSDLFTGMGSDFLGVALAQHPNSLSAVEAHMAVPTLLKLLPTVVTLTGAGLAMWLYTWHPGFLTSMTRSRLGIHLHRFLNGQWLWNSFITGLTIMPSLFLGGQLSKVLDRGLVEQLFAYGPSQMLPLVGGKAARYDTRLVTQYATYVVLGLLGIVLVLFVPFLTGSSIADQFPLILVYVVALVMLP